MQMHSKPLTNFMCKCVTQRRPRGGSPPRSPPLNDCPTYPNVMYVDDIILHAKMSNELLLMIHDGASQRNLSNTGASLTQRLDDPSRALLQSQSGPFAANVLTALPTSPELRLDAAAFRVLLLRRLRLQLPLVPATCPCRRRLDALADHRASCPRSGLLRPRAIPLERAAARVCREAGATVSTNVLLRDLNLVVERQDDRRVALDQDFLPRPALGPRIGPNRCGKKKTLNCN